MTVLKLVLFLAATLRQDVEVRVRPDSIYIETFAGNLTPAERAFFHLIVHNQSSAPIVIESLRFDLISGDGASLSGHYAGEALIRLFDSSVDRRRIEPAVAKSLTLGPDERKAVTDIFLNAPEGFFGDTLNVELQYQSDGNTAIARSRSAMQRSAGFAGRLPFDGTWYVAAEHGHLDAHRRVAVEMFAYDFLQIGANGRSYQRDGSRNSDYFAYGKKVLAAHDGVVAAVRNDVAENPPGTTNTKSPSGNAVILDHGNGHFGYYAHLRPGSISLKAGAKVAAGDVLGEVGNSGDATEPRLHFHVMSSANIDEAEAIPVTFQNWKTQAHSPSPILRESGLLPRGEFVEP